MKVVLSGGGTAGHINPALALAEVLSSQGHEVLFAGTPQGVESRLVPAAGVSFKAFEASGFNRRHPLTLFKGMWKIWRSSKLAQVWLRDEGVDVVVCFGGYVCIPVGYAAEKLGIPVVVHEQNSVMGMANRELAKKAAAVALTYEVAGAPLADKSKLHVTGNPVRSSVFESTREEGRALLGIPNEAKMLLVFGGSLGARHINTALCKLKERLLAIPDLYVVHITGPKELDTVTAELALTQEEQKRWQVMGYQNRMGETMAAADLIVSRAGATSLAEISARCIPAILVPFPFATDDHQTTNARAYVDGGAAWMVADDNVEGEDFANKLLTLIDDEEARASMTKAARAFETGDAAGKLAELVTASVATKPMR